MLDRAPLVGLDRGAVVEQRGDVVDEEEVLIQLLGGRGSLEPRELSEAQRAGDYRVEVLLAEVAGSGGLGVPAGLARPWREGVFREEEFSVGGGEVG